MFLDQKSDWFFYFLDLERFTDHAYGFSYNYPGDTRRQFNIYKKSIRRHRRRIDVL